MRINFDLNNTQAYNGATPLLPPGEYAVEIVAEQENQPLRNGAGTALVFEYQIRDGQFRGQRIRDWLNVGHSNQNARELAQRRIKAIGEAVGLPVFNDTRQLFNRPFLIAVSCQEYQGRQRNQIDDYRPLPGARDGAGPGSSYRSEPELTAAPLGRLEQPAVPAQGIHEQPTVPASGTPTPAPQPYWN